MFTLPGEIQTAYQRSGQASPCTAFTGLWILLPVLEPLIWVIIVNGAVNQYWRSQGGLD